MIEVLLLSKYPLLNQGIQALLRDEADLLVVGQEMLPGQAEECIRERKPAVVIVDDGDSMPGIASAVMHLFKQGLVNNVIELDLDLNVLHLFHREDRAAQCVQDLTRAIHDMLPLAAGREDRCF